MSHICAVYWPGQFALDWMGAWCLYFLSGQLSLFTAGSGFTGDLNFLNCSSSCLSQSGEPLSVPRSDGSDVFSEKIEKLVTDISHLTLLEVSELSTALKQRLNLPDAPVMPIGGFAPAAAKGEVIFALYIYSDTWIR